jgi:hypothetical protein
VAKRARDERQGSYFARTLLAGRDGGAQFGLIRHRAQYNISVQRPAEIINLAMDRARSALCAPERAAGRGK